MLVAPGQEALNVPTIQFWHHPKIQLPTDTATEHAGLYPKWPWMQTQQFQFP
jgi:hypothetical protein